MHAGLYRRHREHMDARILGDTLVPSTPGGAHVVEVFLRAWCERHQHEIRPRNLEYAAFLLDRVGYAMMRTSVDERPHYLDDPEFVDEMVELLVAYLRPAAP